MFLVHAQRTDSLLQSLALNQALVEKGADEIAILISVGGKFARCKVVRLDTQTRLALCAYFIHHGYYSRLPARWESCSGYRDTMHIEAKGGVERRLFTQRAVDIIHLVGVILWLDINLDGSTDAFGRIRMFTQDRLRAKDPHLGIARDFASGPDRMFELVSRHVLFPF